MHIRDLPERTQDYLKAIWDIAEHGTDAVPLGQIAHRVEQRTSTASEAIKRLAQQGLVHHEPYAGVRLTAQGEQLALQMVRRHRLVETFLVSTLGYSWDEVHDDADLLEHAVSDRLLERLDAFLNFPTHDPHGDPIPTADGTVAERPLVPLATIKPEKDGEEITVTVAQVDDGDPELLRYLASYSIHPGTALTLSAPPQAGLVHVTTDAGRTVALAESHVHAIRVIR